MSGCAPARRLMIEQSLQRASRIGAPPSNPKTLEHTILAKSTELEGGGTDLHQILPFPVNIWSFPIMQLKILRLGIFPIRCLRFALKTY